MQTDDTLILVDMNFAKRKKQTIVETKIMIKSRDELESTEANSLKFNDTIIKRLDSNDSNNIHFNQISQLDYLQLIQNVESSIINSRSKIRIKLSSKEQYVAQRARDAYVASICQSKASFDLFLAAQTIEISSNDITTLNKRFQ
jgi:predicted Zn-dependent protease